MTRRASLASLLATVFLPAVRTFAGTARITIVTASAGAPHASALGGLQQVLSAHSVVSDVFALPGAEAALDQALKSGASQLAIAIGIDAVRALAARKAQIPVLATMVFRADLKDSAAPDIAGFQLAGSVWLDLSLSQIVAGLRVVFPAANRVGVILRPTQANPPGMAGVTVHRVDCAGPADLLPALRTLRGQVDFVACLPDSVLYNKTTVEPLIVASLEHRLPLVGYSASFVKAGAALGVYPDFGEIGRQTADIAEHCLAASGGTRDETPRRTVVTVNERVLHLLGREYRDNGQTDVVVIR